MATFPQNAQDPPAEFAPLGALYDPSTRGSLVGIALRSARHLSGWRQISEKHFTKLLGTEKLTAAGSHTSLMSTHLLLLFALRQQSQQALPETLASKMPLLKSTVEIDPLGVIDRNVTMTKGDHVFNYFVKAIENMKDAVIDEMQRIYPQATKAIFDRWSRAHIGQIETHPVIVAARELEAAPSGGRTRPGDENSQLFGDAAKAFQEAMCELVRSIINPDEIQGAVKNPDTYKGESYFCLACHD